MSHLIDFETTFEILTGHPPFPWQVGAYQRLLELDSATTETWVLPTGLGKTSVIAIWLIALASRPTLPRRLIYVVNRRTVVDQTTYEVEQVSRNLSKSPDLEAALWNLCALRNDFSEEQGVPLAISTLRGQFEDNQAWSSDPARPAVICGTVDMIGSRLLFSGYRCSFKTRPLHAGFLGQDAILVHDEAHLEPAFQHLIEAIQREQKRSHDQRPLRIIELSATARSGNADLKLSEIDRQHEIVDKRLTAQKQLKLHPLEDEKKQLADRLTELALEYVDTGCAVLVYARSVESVEKVADALRKDLKKRKFPDAEKRVKILTGTMRGLEREALVESSLFQRFTPGNDLPDGIDPIEGTVYLVSTSAGEVGVNISADHLVCDLSTYESMAQRFGRVNRFGERDDTEVHIVHPTEFAITVGGENDPEIRRERTLRLLQQLNGNASPHALDQLDDSSKQLAFSPTPDFVETSDILFDAWANTTIHNLPGRPPVEEYLHGKAEWETARTEVAWREEVSLLSPLDLERLQLTAEELLTDFPLKSHEVLTDRSDRIFDKLKKLHQRLDQSADSSFDRVWLVHRSGEIECTSLAQIVNRDKKQFAPHTILLAPEMGGLSDGVFEPGSADKVQDVSCEWYNESGNRRRQRAYGKLDVAKGMRLIRTIEEKAVNDDVVDTEDPESKGDQEPNYWNWYVRPKSADDDGSKSAVTPIRWPDHTNEVIAHTEQITSALLSDFSEIQKAVNLAAQFHDFGKRRVVWQRSIGNPNPHEPFEKSGDSPGWGRLIELSPYRHEFGSLLNVLHPNQDDQKEFEARYTEFSNMSPEQQDIVLHLIAVHHGYARPHFPVEKCFDPEGYTIEQAHGVAREVPRRFARLQRRFGRWGLAWLESLFRAADYAASRNLSQPAESAMEGT